MTIVSLSTSAVIDAAMLQLDSFVGDSQTVTGTLDGAIFTSTLSGAGVGDLAHRSDFSIFDDTDPWMNSTSYTPQTALTDKLDLLRQSSVNSATMMVTFSAPILDPVIHLTGMDRTALDFSANTTDLTLLSSYGGLQVISGVISDDNNNNGGGSVRINGTYTSLTIALTETNNETDAMKIQWSGIQAVPEPSSTALLGLGGIALLLRRRR